ncbi:MAG: type II secretion system protein [Vibrio sp.]
MKNKKGFTLIELVVVIVILGILSVTAAPKFLDIQTDARKATLKGLEGAIRASAKMVYAKAIMQGQENINGGKVDAGFPKGYLGNGDLVPYNVYTIYGYPVSYSNNRDQLNISSVVDGLDGLSIGGKKNDQWQAFGVTGGGALRFSPIGTQADSGGFTVSNCYVEYRHPAKAGQEAKITINNKC